MARYRAKKKHVDNVDIMVKHACAKLRGTMASAPPQTTKHFKVAYWNISSTSNSKIGAQLHFLAKLSIHAVETTTLQRHHSFEYELMQRAIQTVTFDFDCK